MKASIITGKTSSGTETPTASLAQVGAPARGRRARAKYDPPAVPSPDYEPSTETERRALRDALELIESLAGEIGPRRPTSGAERRAAERVVSRLRAQAIEVELEPFRGYSSFGYPFAIILGLAALPAVLPRRRRAFHRLSAVLAAAMLAGEGSLRAPLTSKLLSRRPSQNVVATVEPKGGAERTIVLGCHLDTSRSGLLFDPRFVRYLGAWISAQSGAVFLQAIVELLPARGRGLRRLRAGLRLIPFVGLALLAQRELAGEDVPGANDNASGCAVVATLASELARNPLEGTRVIALFTGCEESGTLGSQEFLRSRETAGWSFVNFDNVGGDCTVRYLTREGVMAKFDADPGLIAACERIAAERPELGLLPEADPAGLTYDTTPVLANGGRAITVSVQDGYIPDLHWPTDTPERIAPAAVAATLEVGRELLAAAEEGQLD